MAEIITEVLGRADTGVSVNPFFCKTEHGREIYVKPFGVLPTSLIAEWIGGRLAQLMDLPCADITIVEIPQILVEATRNPEWYDLKAGFGFGSFYLGSDYRDLQATDLTHLDPMQLAEVFLFDYWIRNGDRKMGPAAGNPNTLVHYLRDHFRLIDHDNAFDPAYSFEADTCLHIGLRVKEVWMVAAKRSAWLMKAHAACDALEEIWQEIPEEWLYTDLDNLEEASYTLNQYREILEVAFTDPDTFWSPFMP
ncbi:HipA family kinase [Rubritalea tangerina]|uniref:HipA family kinase n=1 Tax=Rubritalea tangerina TaxID=430798 RepID=A0ABW4Z8M3_9BACT